MREELEQKLFREFPSLYKPEKTPQETLMCFGFECNDGWFDIIYRLSTDLSKIKDLEAIQVKEKFGTLRFYTNFSTKEINERISLAEKESEVTCEYCGKLGKIREVGWIKTLCDDCNKNK